jgi:sortase A
MGRRVTALSLAGLALATGLGAIGFFLYPFYTDWHAGRQQAALRESFRTTSIKDAYRAKKLVDGAALTRIVVPAMGTDSMVVEGISQKALNTGAGHYPDTPLPGEPGNVAIAGHRTTYGRPFARQEGLKEGDKVYLYTPFAKHTYEVVAPFGGHGPTWVTGASDWSVAEPTPGAMLTLTTCHPRGKATHRLVTRAKLISTEPVAA